MLLVQAVNSMDSGITMATADYMAPGKRHKNKPEFEAFFFLGGVFFFSRSFHWCVPPMNLFDVSFISDCFVSTSTNTNPSLFCGVLNVFHLKKIFGGFCFFFF